ncbi:hypothetical protein QYS49_39400 [Marivirga salinae]|uniref:Uncharacterized protein n=1 Tax=Marivirga salinarum TaxID=3059078 RepID=A0AA51NDN6_9BACT|nr:hypothetical protein [Marivirga sp. BDSF4-3]WMN11725.1 hypothetical protein QYS49_39400 [Marivirga sp. BDSF4-3]
MDLDKISKLIGIIVIIAIAKYIWNLIFKKTNTSIISDHGLEILEDPDKKKQLRKAVDEYHETGDWNETQLKSIV